MESLLRKFRSENDRLLEYAHHLLSVFSSDRNTSDKNGQPLIEPLSDRELELLALLAEGLTNQQIADKLYLSKNTVKVHIRNIYQKLGVSSRVQAVHQGRLYELLPED